MDEQTPSILDSPAISGCYLFPYPRFVAAPFTVEVDGIELAYFRPKVQDGRLSLGLVSMKERADLLGGSLSVQSSPGKGCQIVLYVPSDGMKVATN